MKKLVTINTNIDALNSCRLLTNTNRKNEKVMEKLSSGLKINRAADDSAGLAISVKMRAQIRGLSQDERNIDDGISMFSVAEGGMSEVEGMVHRIRELAVQSSNDANTDEDRQKMQGEVEQLIKGIDGIAHDTEFNTHKVLLGQMGTKTVTTTKIINTYSFDSTNTVSQSAASSVFTHIASNWNNSTGGALATRSTFSIIDATTGQRITPGFSISPNFGIDDYLQNNCAALTQGVYTNFDAFLMDLNSNPNSTNSTIFAKAIAAAMDAAIRSTSALSSFNIPTVQGEITTNGNVSIKIGDGSQYYIRFDYDPVTGINYGNCGPTGVSVGHAYLHSSFGGAVGTSTATSTSQSFVKTYVPNDYIIQVGANQDQHVLFQIPAMAATVVGTLTDQTIDKADVTTQAKADETIAICDEALDYVSESRALMGAHINRLEHAKSSVTNYHLNISGAESRLRDADMSKGIMEQVKGNILQQSAVAMLAQANQKPQNLLQLLN